MRKENIKGGDLKSSHKAKSPRRDLLPTGRHPDPIYNYEQKGLGFPSPQALDIVQSDCSDYIYNIASY